MQSQHLKTLLERATEYEKQLAAADAVTKEEVEAALLDKFEFAKRSVAEIKGTSDVICAVYLTCCVAESYILGLLTALSELDGAHHCFVLLQIMFYSHLN